MKNRTLYAGLIFLYICTSCTSQNKKVRLLVDIPVENDKIVSIFNLSNGTQVYEDTLRGELVLDSLTYGIHLLTVMWDRDVISPDEFKSLRPHTLDNPSYYSLQKRVFIDPREGGTIRLYSPDNITKEEIEEQLLSDERTFAPSLEVEGKQAQLYEAYESIWHQFRQQHHSQRDSLKKLLYHYNDKNDLQQAAAVNSQIKDLWTSTILPQYEMEKKQFLIEHADDIIVPFILLDRVTSQELYQSFKPVIDAMPEKYRELGFVKGLAKLRSGK
ncbi:hypothetical protein [Sphingobacterium haloxyli]|uniref:DUF4369 domain-containing protein n=1 Tax=Sphingobacterium haloxyli TaxID=2100533 RepID=A0A2S9J8S4_9SPHI|nr:hypothetical protein [Sphingobacterium haloxyli]PRD49188.1 hypothetical protein C5745_00680 [Sphingobacterium haloxyli]